MHSTDSRLRFINTRNSHEYENEISHFIIYIDKIELKISKINYVNLYSKSNKLIISSSIESILLLLLLLVY